MIISEYRNENGTRTAKVMSLRDGSYTVSMIDGGGITNVENCNLEYAQDLAENFVMKWGEFSSPGTSAQTEED